MRREKSTDEAEVMELVECGECTETFSGLFVCAVAYSGDLGYGFEQEGTAVGRVSWERGRE